MSCPIYSAQIHADWLHHNASFKFPETPVGLGSSFYADSQPRPAHRSTDIVKTVFKPGKFVAARDGTEIDPFLNPMDAAAGVALPGVSNRVSVAAGRLRPSVVSAIHVHPVVTQITYVVSGCLTVKTVESGEPRPREFTVEAGAAAVTLPGQPVQFRNDTQADVTVLYIVTPGYVSDDTYDDAVLFDDWSPSLSDEDLADARVRRTAALRRGEC